MNFLTYWKLEIAFIVLFLAFGAGWCVKGKFDDVQAAKLEIAHQQALIAAQTIAMQKQKQSETISQGVSNALENRLSSIDSLYAVSLLPSSAAGGNMSPVPNAAGGHNAAACPAGFSQRIQERVAALMKQADMQTARLVACQAWIQKQAQ